MHWYLRHVPFLQTFAPAALERLADVATRRDLKRGKPNTMTDTDSRLLVIEGHLPQPERELLAVAAIDLSDGRRRSESGRLTNGTTLDQCQRLLADQPHFLWPADRWVGSITPWSMFPPHSPR